MSFKLPYKWELVILLWLCFFFNQADRQIFNVVLPDIQHELGLSYAQMGLIASILTLVYGMLVPIAGILGDRGNKKNIIIISLLIWSTATLLTGISMTLFELILLRSIATGGGEAFYAPSANALISEYHQKTRATALSVHQTALYVGIIFSGYIAGYIADLYGWRNAFYMFGGFGIILAIVIYFRLTRFSKNANEEIDSIKRKSIKETLIVFFKKPTALLLTAASVIIGARISDRLCKKYSRIRIIILMAGLFLGAPFIYFMGESNSLLVVYIALPMFGLFRGVYDSNIFASLYDVIEAPYRATATGIMLMIGFCVAALSPYILGVLQPTLGLSKALSFYQLFICFQQYVC